jgi:DNA repair exonuclease SbcCD ATPase subunit
MLKIKKVTVHNFCQHEHRELEFTDGLTGIFGANGIGKSNLANAITGAFTGVFQHVDGIAGCIRQGSDGNTFVSVDGTLADQVFNIHREVTPKGVKHKLSIDGKPTINRAADIESWITKVSGITPQLMSEFIFIRQQEMFSFLDAPNAERARKFSALCETGIYEVKREKYADYFKTDKLKYEYAKSLQVETIAKDLAAIQLQLDQWINPEYEQTPAKQLETELNQYEERETARLAKREKQLNDVQYAIKLCEQTAATLSQTQLQCDTAQQAINQLQSELDDVTAKLGALRKGNPNDVQAYIDLNKNLAHHARILLNWEETKPDVFAPEDIGTPRRMLDEIEMYLNDSQEALHKHNAAIKQTQEVYDKLTAIGHKASCELCGADKQHWQYNPQILSKMIAEHRDAADELKPEVESLAEMHRQWYEYTLNVEEFNRLSDYRWEPAENKRDFIAQLEYNSSYVSSLLDQEKDFTANIKANKQVLDTHQPMIANLMRQLGVQMGNVVSLLNDSGVTESEVADELAKIQTQRKTMQAAIAYDRKSIHLAVEYEAKRDSLIAVRDAKKTQLDQAQKAITECNTGTQWFDKFERALSWMHRDGLPRVIHRAVLRRLTDAINEELSEYADGFNVTVNDDVTFTAHFPKQNRSINAKGLSVGQKAMLAFAFHGALGQTLVQNLGIMLFDEPTAGLDDLNSEVLTTILTERNRRLIEKKQQWVLNTHNKLLTPAFASVINLGNLTT